MSIEIAMSIELFHIDLIVRTLSQITLYARLHCGCECGAISTA